MKLAILLTIAFALNAVAKSNAQKITLRAENTALRDVMQEIQRQQGYSFFFRGKDIAATPITTQVREADLGQAMQAILEGQDLEWRIADGIITISNKSTEASTATPRQQERAVNGRVFDEHGNPLPGVTVQVKGAATRTVTDGGGNYRIRIDNPKQALTFSLLGYATAERAAFGQETIDVTMRPSVSDLDEVVVVGYGTQSRKTVTAAITKVQGASLQNVPATNVDALMQGLAPGVQVVQNSGAPGDETYLRIRGNGSLFGENRPLYVIDGVPMNNIAPGAGPQSFDGQRISAQNDINPNDIESIEVLKDAAAAAIYGSRGGNGVILITTKKGAQGKAKFNAGWYTGVAQVTNRLPLLNAAQYAEMVAESRKNGNMFEDPIAISDASTDWQDAIFRSAPVSNYSLSTSGGTDRARYYISAGHFNQKGTVIGQHFKRINGRINFDVKASERLSLGVNITGNHSLNNRRDNGFSGESLMALALTQSPNNPIRNADGSYFRDPRGIRNPVLVGNELRFQSLNNRFVGNAFATYEFLKDLKFKTSWGFDNLSVTDDRYQSRAVNNFGNANGAASVYSVLLWVNENTLTYTKALAGGHKLSALLGQSMQESAIRRIGAGGNTSSTDILETISGFTNRTETSDFRSQWGLLSFFSRVGYDYKQRYMLEAAVRADGSSRFGRNRKFGYFPSVSAGWNVDEEAFMDNQHVISTLKLRASIGLTGNSEGLGSDFPALATYALGANYGTLPGIAPNSLSNVDLSWESTTQTNLGLEAGFLDGRLSASLDLYDKTTNDLIFKLELPYTSGFNRTFGANIGQMKNRGLEAVLSSINIQRAFVWTTAFNISYNRNKITYLPLTVADDPSSSDFFESLPNSYNSTNPTSIFRVGQAVGSFFGYLTDGVDPETGDIIYRDITGDGKVTTEDRTIIGNALPKHTGGLTNTFSYKGVELSAFLYWSYGNDVYNQTRVVLERMSSFNNGNTNVLRRWTPENRHTDIPRAVWGDPAGPDGIPNGQMSPRFVEDGSFLRLKNVTLAYQLPENTIKRLGFSNAKIYLSAQNLFTWTNYSGYDPEVQNQQFKNSQLGIDWVSQPQPRTFMAGFNVAF